MCQKAVGNVFAALAPVREQDLLWTRGTPASFRSSSVADRLFCPACGTPLAFCYIGSQWIGLTIGSFDQPSVIVPVIHYGVESRLPWLCAVMTGLPEEATEATVDSPVMRPDFINLQHPDHDTDR